LAAEASSALPSLIYEPLFDAAVLSRDRLALFILKRVSEIWQGFVRLCGKATGRRGWQMVAGK